MISLERQENIAVERDTLPESYHTVLRRSSSVVVFSWRTKCAGRAGLVTYSTAFQLSASPRLPRQHGPLSRRILSPKVHSYPVCIQASEKKDSVLRSDTLFRTQTELFTLKNNRNHPKRGISTHALQIPTVLKLIFHHRNHASLNCRNIWKSVIKMIYLPV